MEAIDSQIPRDLVEPWEQRPLLLEPVQTPERPDHRLLRNIRRILVVANDPVGDSVDRFQIPGDEETKRGTVSCLRPSNQSPLLNAITHDAQPYSFIAVYLHSPWAHATICPVKAALRLLVRFIIWFSLVVLVSAALVLAHRYVTGFDPAGATGVAPLLGRLMSAAVQIWIPAALLAVAITHFSAVRSLRGSLASLLVVAVVATGTLLAGGYLLGLPVTQYPAGTGGLPEARLIRSEGLRLYALDRQGLLVSPLLVETMDEEVGFSVVAQATIDLANGELILQGDPARVVDLRGFSNSYASMAQVPRIVNGLISDVRQMNELLVFVPSSARGPLLNLLALGAYAVGIWSLARLTKWPLFNVLFVLGSLRFAVWIVPAIQTGALREVTSEVLSPSQLPVASAASLGAVALALLALLVFLPSLSEWRREVSGE